MSTRVLPGLSIVVFLLSSCFLWASEHPSSEFQSFSLNSKTLGDERQIQVYLPSSYKVGTRAYPVIYVLDGGFLFEPVVTISKVRASRDLMPESIIVGIKNPSNAQRFGMGRPKKRSPQGRVSFEKGKPQDFLAFLEKELMPHIEKQYRIAKHRILIGMSPTNGPVITGFMTRPDLFQGYVAMAADPHFYTLDDELLAKKLVEVAQSYETRQGWFYISRGGLDVPHNSPQLPDAFAILDKGFQSLKGKFTAKAEIIPGGEHYGSALESIIQAFALIYTEETWRPNYRKLRQSKTPTMELKSFYENLSSAYGFKAYPVVDGYWMGSSLGGLTRRLLRAKNYGEAENLLTWGLTYHPGSIDLHYYLSRLFEMKNDMTGAIKSAKMVVDLADKQASPDLKFYQDRVKSLTKKAQEKTPELN